MAFELDLDKRIGISLSTILKQKRVSKNAYLYEESNQSFLLKVYWPKAKCVHYDSIVLVMMDEGPVTLLRGGGVEFFSLLLVEIGSYYLNDQIRDVTSFLVGEEGE